MARLGNTAEGGTDGVEVTAANSGGSSGDAFDAAAVQTDGASVVEYDTARAGQGTTSIRFLAVAGANDASVGWTTSFGTKTFVAGRATFEKDADFSDTQNKVIRLLDGGSHVCSLSVKSDGKFQLLNAANAQVAVSTSVIPTDQQVRFEFEFTLSATDGVMKVWYYTSPTATTEAELLQASTLVLRAQATQYLFGLSGRSAGSTTTPSIWMDAIDLNDVGKPGPFSTDITPTSIASAEDVGNPTLTRAGASTRWTWAPSGIDGAGFQNTYDVSPLTAGECWVGADVGGIHRSLDNGDSWTMRNTGLYRSPSLGIASIRCSETVPGRTYAAIGGPSAGFWRYDAGNDSWTELAGSLNFFGGNTLAANPDLPYPHPRSTGRLIELFESSNIAYCGTAANGLVRVNLTSGAVTNIGLQGGSYYIRGIYAETIDTIYVAVSDEEGTNTANGGVWRISNASTNPTAPVKMTAAGAPTNAEELMVAGTGGNRLVVACGNQGIRMLNLQSGVWSNITGSLTVNAQWCSLAQTSDGGTWFVGCADPATITTNQFACIARTTNQGDTWTVLTGSANISNLVSGTPGDTWWLSVSQPSMMLGKGSYVAAQLVVDPLNDDVLYSTGRSGVWRTLNARAASNLVLWHPVVRNLQGTINRSIAADPVHPDKVLVANTDWVAIYSDDGLESVIQRKPPSGQSGGPVDAVSATGFDLAAYDVGGADARYTIFFGDRDDNTYGEVLHASALGTNNTWSDTNLNNLTNGKKPVGGDSRRIGGVDHIVAFVANDFGGGDAQTATGLGGIWQWSSSGGWTHKMNAATAGNAMSIAQGSNKRAVVRFASDTVVYGLDRKTGIWRNSNFPSGSWTKVWSVGHGTYPLDGLADGVGYIAVDPTNAARLWVSTATKVYRWDNASTTSVDGGTAPQGNFTVARPGPIVVDDEGQVFVCRRANSSGNATLLRSADSGTNWTDEGDAIYRGQAGFPQEIALDVDGKIYVSTQGMGVVVGSPIDIAPTTQTVTPGSILSAELVEDGLILTNATPPSQSVGPGLITSAEAFGQPILTTSTPPEPPPVPGGENYYLPPTQPHLPVHRRRYLDHMGVPGSRTFRTYYKTDKTPDGHSSLRIGGVTYRGGVWNGPLTEAEYTAIVAAGYADRLVNVATAADLPSGLDT